MGLSLLSATFRPFRRRFGSKASSKAFTARRSSTTNVGSVFNRRMLRPITSEDLIELLQSLEKPLTPSQASAVASRITNDPTLFDAFIQRLTAPPITSSQEPRVRLVQSWMVSTFVRFGPPALRLELSRRPDLIRNIAAVFATPTGKLDPALATNAADVIRIMLHEYPRETASALHKTQLARNLVSHVDLQPAADLMPRLISHRIFSALPHPPLVAMHKRSIALLGDAKVQDRLADVFVEAAENFNTASPSQRQHLVSVLEHSAATMGEICFRAMCIQRKHEDQDERADGAYVASLIVVTSHCYNDYLHHMTLLEKPIPLQRVVTAALKVSEETDVLLPAIKLVTAVLSAFRDARSSILPSVRRTVHGLDLNDLANTLASLGMEFFKLLDEDKPVLGRRRLAVIDLIRECCELLPEGCVEALLMANDEQLLRRVVGLARKYKTNDVLQVRVSQILHAVFSNCQEVSMEMLMQTDILDFLVERKNAKVMDPPLGALLVYVQLLQKGKKGDKRYKTLVDLVTYFQQRKSDEEDDEDSLLVGLQTNNAKVSSEVIYEMNLEHKLTANEDYGQEMFLHHMLDEVSIEGNLIPPDEHHVMQSAISLGKGLSGKLKDAVNHHAK